MLVFQRAVLPVLHGPLFADDIAVFYALKAEAQLLGQPVKVGARSIQRLRLGAHTVHAVKMGAGAVETAVSAEALLARFPCDRGFSLGPVGAIGDKHSAGDWLWVAEMVPHKKGRGRLAVSASTRRRG